MKYYELKACAQYLNSLVYLNSVTRVDDNILKLSFDKKITLYADLKKGGSTLFMCAEFKVSKIYKAPFDIILAKRFTSVNIKSIDTLGENRVLVIKVEQKNAYKIVNSILFLEFTGRNTNAIILDEDEIVLEALRHIDISKSYRYVKVGEKLKPLPPHVLKEKPQAIDDVNKFLHELYFARQNEHLENLKNQKRLALHKKIERFNLLLTNLEKEEDVQNLANKLHEYGMLLLSNRHSINSYDKELNLTDFNGESVKIELNKNSVQESIDDFFTRSKKLKQKAKSLYIEKENLEEKYEFLKRLDEVVKSAASEEEINILLPKQSKNDKKQSENSLHESFFIDGFKVMIGKNEKGNIALLKESKKNDIWMHVKNFPSAHIIIKTNKTLVAQNVLSYAAKLCVELSGFKHGNYIIDYTKRQNVKIQNGANVNYSEYKSLYVNKK